MKDQYVWGEYVVASVDVLGQKCQFKRIENFFIDDVPQETLDDMALKTVGVVESIRDTLNELFLVSMEPVAPKIAVPESERTEYDRSRMTSPIKFQFYSDSILAYVALRATGYQLNDMFAIQDLFVSLGGTMLMTLATGASFRAAIEMGIGTEFQNGDLYGPVRAKAYNLENEKANYPRIVIGDRLFKYLESFSEGRPRIPCQTDRESQGCKNIADVCRKMIAKDPVDETLILDYLGNELIFKNDSEGEARGMAGEYVEKELRERSASKDDKVADKFRKLHDYFESRLRRT